VQIEDNKNILFQQIIIDSSTSLKFKEVVPFYLNNNIKKALILNENKDLMWDTYINSVKTIDDNNISIINDISNGNLLLRGLKNSNNINLSIDKLGSICIDASVDTRVIINNKLKGTNIYYNDDRIGIGRAPMHMYKFDVEVPENMLMTAFHIGDGTYGFSMGNGTSNGFLPEIIGMGSDENDAGLYFLGRAGNNLSSNIPLIIIDGRNRSNNFLTNRPIFGVTSANYNEYELIINHNGNVGIGKFPEIYKLEVNGTIYAKDFLLDSSISMNDIINIIIEQKQEIDILKNKITVLEGHIKKIK